MSTKLISKRLSILGLSLAIVLIVISLLAGCGTTASPTPTPATPTATTRTTTSPTTTTPATSTPAASTPASPSATASPSPSPNPTPRTSYNPKEVLLSSTTSVRDSGLMDQLIPIFEQESGYFVTPVYVGSGAAIALGKTGNADVMIVHQPSGEIAFMNDGYGSSRRLIMHNDFVVLGPASDPAQVKATTTAVDAFKAIIAGATQAGSNVTFYSRGDNSGTDACEKGIFKKAGLTVADKSPDNPKWYIEAPGGMGALLLVADQNQGYTLSDRGVYLAYQDKITLKIVSEGDPAYLNPYHVIEVSPTKFPGIINVEGAKAFADFMVGSEAQDIIANFKDKLGNLMFVPDGGKTDADLGI